jgi:hypothetical protein
MFRILLTLSMPHLSEKNVLQIHSLQCSWTTKKQKKKKKHSNLLNSDRAENHLNTKAQFFLS